MDPSLDDGDERTPYFLRLLAVLSVFSIRVCAGIWKAYS